MLVDKLVVHGAVCSGDILDRYLVGVGAVTVLDVQEAGRVEFNKRVLSWRHALEVEFSIRAGCGAQQEGHDVAILEHRAQLHRHRRNSDISSRAVIVVSSLQIES